MTTQTDTPKTSEKCFHHAPDVEYILDIRGNEHFVCGSCKTDLTQEWHAAGAEVVFRWREFRRASTPLEQANALVSLSNAMSDLGSWIPGYDIDHDTFPWETGED